MDKEIYTGIYKITCETNGKFYIGSACHIKRRWRQHKSDLLKNKHKNPRLQNAWNKYGPNNFTFNIVEHCAKEDVVTREQYWLDITEAVKNGFNCNHDAESPNIGLIRTPEQRINMSIAQRKRSPESRILQARAIRCRKHTSETIAKMSIAKKGKNKSLETRAKMSAAQKGKKVSPETRAKIAATLTGKKLSPETCAKLAAAHTGKKHSLEARVNMSAAQKGRIISPIHRAKISATLKRKTEATLVASVLT